MVSVASPSAQPVHPENHAVLTSPSWVSSGLVVAEESSLVTCTGRLSEQSQRVSPLSSTVQASTIRNSLTTQGSFPRVPDAQFKRQTKARATRTTDKSRMFTARAVAGMRDARHRLRP
jgi:hypothetical protein